MTQTITKAKTLTATYVGKDLSEFASSCNSGTNDNTRYYVNGNKVQVSYIYSNMSENEQRDNLIWFCGCRLVSIS